MFCWQWPLDFILHSINGYSVIHLTRFFLIVCCLLCGLVKNADAQDDIAAGKAKAATSCASCHGADGSTSVSPNVPKLAGQNEAYISKELLDFQLGPKGGRNSPVMANFVAGMSKADIAVLAAYYASLPCAVGTAKPENIALGQKLYRGGDIQRGIPACAACHGPDGWGNPPAAFPGLSGQNSSYVADQLKAFRSGTRRNDWNQIMRDIAAKMTDQDIDAVANYVSGLH